IAAETGLSALRGASRSLIGGGKMQRASMLVAGLIGVTLAVSGGCSKTDQAPQPATPNQVAPPGPYAPPQAQASAPAYAPPQGGPAAPPPGMAVPGPAALPCSNDSMCLTHRCNTQYGKCAFPCESDNDCVQGAFCFKGPVPSCWLKGPGQP